MRYPSYSRPWSSRLSYQCRNMYAEHFYCAGAFSLKQKVTILSLLTEKKKKIIGIMNNIERKSGLDVRTAISLNVSVVSSEAV